MGAARSILMHRSRLSIWLEQKIRITRDRYAGGQNGTSVLIQPMICRDGTRISPFALSNLVVEDDELEPPPPPIEKGPKLTDAEPLVALVIVSISFWLQFARMVRSRVTINACGISGNAPRLLSFLPLEYLPGGMAPKLQLGRSNRS